MFYSSILYVNINKIFMTLPYLLPSSIKISETLSSNELQNPTNSIHASIIDYNTQVIDYIFLETIFHHL